MSGKKKLIIRILYSSVIFAALVSLVVFESIQYAFRQANEPVVVTPEPFPISVNPIAKRIEPNVVVDDFFSERLAESGPRTWLARLAAALAPEGWYQNLASPVSRIFVIWPGERKEQVAKHLAGVLRWDAAETERFLDLVTSAEPAFAEGVFYPDSYVAHRNATPEEVAELVRGKFDAEITARYPEELEALVPLNDALIIASLLEREASDFQNMREVAGVIWNRQFIDMPLQLDATLQYVRGSYPGETSWWPAARPADKQLDSPYNTYRNAGLPPAPIANVSAEAVLAALNPIATNCIFYFHGPDRSYYCSETYEEHKRKLQDAY